MDKTSRIFQEMVHENVSKLKEDQEKIKVKIRRAYISSVRSNGIKRYYMKIYYEALNGTMKGLIIGPDIISLGETVNPVSGERIMKLGQFLNAVFREKDRMKFDTDELTGKVILISAYKERYSIDRMWHFGVAFYSEVREYVKPSFVADVSFIDVLAVLGEALDKEQKEKSFFPDLQFRKHGKVWNKKTETWE